MSEFYRRLRAVRGERQLTQQELADALGISKSSVNMYERGEREPGLDLLEKIARFFGVDVDDLLGLRPEQETDSREHRLRMVARRAAGLPQAQPQGVSPSFSVRAASKAPSAGQLPPLPQAPRRP